MFFLLRPSEPEIRAILARQSVQNFSYPEVGASAGTLPANYAVLRGRADLGRGSATFDRAMQALRQWKMFDVPGVTLCWPDALIKTGVTVAILIKHFGFLSLNFCTIVYVVDEDRPTRRFGFAYGTLDEHAEKGEERFLVEWSRDSDRVSYDILSFSKPGHIATRIALPAARWLQKRFVRDSLAAMAKAVAK